MSVTPTPAPTSSDVADDGRIRLGGSLRLPASPRDVADNGRIGLGGSLRLPANRG